MLQQPCAQGLYRESQALLRGYRNWVLLALYLSAVILGSPGDVDWFFCVAGVRWVPWAAVLGIC